MLISGNRYDGYSDDIKKIPYRPDTNWLIKIVTIERPFYRKLIYVTIPNPNPVKQKYKWEL